MKPTTIPDLRPSVSSDALPAGVDPVVTDVLLYLRDKLPGYNFQLALDTLFVRELMDDFPNVDVLEEIKTFRWYFDRELGKKNHRASIRRWMANTKPRTRW
ncbi:MAG: hypothetical protein GY906_19375 [bacterium]|nr:hypothetical protein [bacterium]